MFNYLYVHVPSFHHWRQEKKKDKVEVPQWNGMLSLYCTTLGFISKNAEYNPE